MKTKSAKAKGRRLQNWVRDKIQEVFAPYIKNLDPNSVRSSVMGEGGVDITIYSPQLLTLFPYKIECKSQRLGFSALYAAYKQCCEHEGGLEPLVFIKMDREKPLAVVDAEYFLDKHGYIAYLTPFEFEKK